MSDETYIILECENRFDLQESIEKCLSKGYKLHGSVSVALGQGYKPSYCQAMILTESRTNIQEKENDSHSKQCTEWEPQNPYSLRIKNQGRPPKSWEGRVLIWWPSGMPKLSYASEWNLIKGITHWLPITSDDKEFRRVLKEELEQSEREEAE